MHRKSFKNEMKEEESFLNIQEAAAILKTSASTLRRWVRQGTLIAHRSDTDIRFCKKELKLWMKKAGLSGLKEQSEQRGKIKQADLLEALANGQYLKLQTPVTRDWLYMHISQLATRNIQGCTTEELFDKMIKREEVISTEIVEGVAIPHPKRRGEKIFITSQVFPVILNQPIALNSSTSTNTNLLFFLFASSPEEHLKLLAQLAKKISRTPSLIAHCIESDSMESLMKLFVNCEQ